jgi:hypothetical protein
MGFNKYYVPEPGELVKQISENGPLQFSRVRNKIDAMIGSTDSVRIIEHLFGMAATGLSDLEMRESLNERFPGYFQSL